ncbi:hyccin isoform X2 [Schistocerca gregaria]|uniref:hyccin isoform X2 n=1 Tax=Schistocerca gregaria TaxID=7010 RepID=UPI00211F249C|nr:hyccin isoform X2 [Schistocerca gregaria]XP_049857808.1 hyccin isoform X2 [Schistocerca gregaria]
MAETVREWLQDCAGQEPDQLHSFAVSLEHNHSLIAALHSVLEERGRFADLVDPVCSQLFELYRSKQPDLQRFTLQFLPTLIFVYLNSVAHGDKKSCRSVETLLLGLYNLEVVDESGQPKIISFRLPSLAQGSIYHEPMSLAPLTESALRRWEECNTKPVQWGPMPQVETLNAQNRLKVMTALLFLYNQQLSLASKSALEYLSKVCSKIVTQGFSKPGHHQRSSYGSDSSSLVPRLLPRIPVASQFLLELLHGAYFSLFNGAAAAAQAALDDLHTRACFEGYPEVVLATNAVRNSLQVNTSGQPTDGPMGISVALTPATTTVTTVSKSMITNASFRTKKLPDDIPIQTSKEDGSVSGTPESKNLSAITEEGEGDGERLTPRASSLRTRDKKLPSFPGLKKTARSNGVAASDKKPKRSVTAESNGPLQPPSDSPDSGAGSSEGTTGGDGMVTDAGSGNGSVEVEHLSATQVSTV